MNEKKEKDKVQIAFEILEHVYVDLNNYKMRKSNQHHLGHPDRVEHDFTEGEKEHLALLRSKVIMEISEKFNRTLLESSESSDRLGNKIFWLNIVMVIFTAVLAISSIIELSQ